jgi:EpsI family protein
MSKNSVSIRLWVTIGILLSVLLLLQTMSHGEAIVPRQPLQDLPYALAAWTGKDQPLEQDVLRVVGVSDYANRYYSSSSGPPVQLYVGYYASQRTGDTIHSPKNCLPGSGWDPIRSGYATLYLTKGRKIVVNEYLIQQDQNKQLVFYWYQGRGRVIASEYAGKLCLVADALSRNRTDGALVRLVTPIQDGEEKARERLTEFTQELFPALDKLIPN